tara:strand:+ start:128 stop:313 length:186 start_codon:yes stop_codon:yes gene_type:complete
MPRDSESFSQFFADVVYQDERKRTNRLPDEERTTEALVEIGSACKILPSAAPQQISKAIDS